MQDREEGFKSQKILMQTTTARSRKVLRLENFFVPATRFRTESKVLEIISNVRDFFRLFEVQERLCEDLDFKNIRSEKIYRRNLALTHLQLSWVCLELKRLQASIPAYYDGPYS